MASASSRPVPRRPGERLLPIDWGEIGTLRLRAQVVAEGMFTGMHHSSRRGAGVELGGQRPYVVGDDLRFLDRRSLLKHDRLVVRTFETDTDRALWLCPDASASMAFRGPEAPGAKLAYAALIAAALCRVALADRDPVGLSWLGGARVRDLPPRSGLDGFERVVGALEAAQAGGELWAETDELQRFAATLTRRAERGSVLVLLSDLVDLPQGAEQTWSSLASGSRALVVVQVLDPAERDFPYRGKVRLRAIEGQGVVETDADAARRRYQERLEAQASAWRKAIEAEGGRLVRACSTDPPVRVVRQVVQAVREARR